MKGGFIAVSRAPDDPERKAKWAYHMMRIQVAIWIDEGAKCAQCRRKYTSVDDFLARSPKSGGKKHPFVDSACWQAFVAKEKGRK